MLKHSLYPVLLAIVLFAGHTVQAQNTIFNYNECPGFLQYSPIVKLYIVPKDSVLPVINGRYSIPPDHALLQKAQFSIPRNLLDSFLKSPSVLPGHYLYVTIDQNQVSVAKYHKKSFTAHILDMGFTSLLEVTDNDLQQDSTVTVQMNKKTIPYDHVYRAYILPYLKQGDTVTVSKDNDIQYYYANVQKQHTQRDYEQHYPRNVESKYTGYVVTNKPKYLPGDTVKWKAYLLDPETGKPSTDTMLLKISDQIEYTYRPYQYPAEQAAEPGKRKKKKGKKAKAAANTTTATPAHRPYDYDDNYGTNYMVDVAVAPVKPGVYFDEFILSDSMDIDVTYNLILTGNKGNRLHTQFLYEDYLLNDMKIKVKGDEYTTYQNGDSIRLYVYASTANNLPVMDGTVAVTVTPVYNYANNGKKPFADTLFHEEITIDPSGETGFKIPTSSYPKQSGMLNVLVSVLNSNNERKDTTFSVNYLAAPYYLRAKQTGNVVKVDMIKNQRSVKGTGIYYKNNLSAKHPVAFPCEITVGPGDETLRFIIDSAYNNESNRDIYVSLDNDKLTTSSRYIKDTAYLEINNPQKAFVRLSIYSGNEFIGLAQTSGDTVLKIYNKDRETATVKACYTWKNWQEKKFTIYNYDKDINIDVHKKDIVYPGQTDSISIRLSDKDGNPVTNTNLTVLAFNNQFEEDFVPELPYSGLLKDGVSTDTTRMLSHFNAPQMSRFRLMDRKWVTVAGADTTFLYQQILVNDKTNTWIRYKLNDSIPSQMSVHIMENGIYYIPEIIYVDNEPVYYRPVNTNSPDNHNGFNIAAGKHTITVRMPGNEYRIRDVNIAANTSLILFINGDLDMPASITRTKTTTTLTPSEKSTLINRYVMFKPEYKGDAGENIDIFGNTVANNNIAQHKDYKPYMTNYNIHFQQNERRYLLNYHTRYSAGQYRGNGYNYGYGEVLLAGPFLTGTPITFYQFNNTKQAFFAEPGNLFIFRDGVQRVEKIEATNFIHNAVPTEYWPDMCYKVPQAMQDPDTFAVRLKPDTLYPTYNLYENHTQKAGADSFALVVRISNYYHHYNNGYNLEGTYFIFRSKDAVVTTPLTDQAGTTMVRNMRPGVYSIELIQRDIPLKLKGRMTIKKGYATHLSVVFNSYIPKEEAGRSTVTYTKSGNTAAGGSKRISGVVTDENGEPVIGAMITVLSGNIIKGGAVTDIDGNYVIAPLAPGIYEVQGKYPSYRKIRVTGVSVSNDREATVNLHFYPNALEEVVVQYSPPLITRDGSANARFSREDVRNAPTMDMTKMVASGGGMVTNDRSGAINAAGSRGGNTIAMLDGILIRGSVPNQGQGTINEVFEGTSKEFLASSNTQAFISEFMVNQLLASGMRNNFRDYAIWQPNLWTDKNGETHFNVTYPDNITGWKTYVLAMNEHSFSGRALQMTNAFKPLSAQLSVPRFLRYGDTVYGIGKVSNYTAEPFSVQSSFLQNGTELAGERITVNNIKVANLQITAPVKNSTDTGKVVATYSIKADNGFMDGEEKQIPVFFTGTTESTGTFAMMPRDTTIHTSPDSSKHFTGKTYIMIDGSMLEVMLREIENLKEYPYGCTEQLTTRLLAISYEEEVKRIMGVDSVNNAVVRDSIITQLVKKQNMDGSFGWWGNNNADHRVTNYVVSTMAKINKDHKLDLVINQGLSFLARHLNSSNRQQYLQSLSTLSANKVDLNYGVLLETIEDSLLSMHDSFIVTTIRKEQGLPYRQWLDSLVKRAHTKNGIAWGHDSYDWYSNQLATTLVAYRLMEHDSSYSPLKDRILQYLMYSRRTGYYRNTAESGQVLTTILPGLMGNTSTMLKDKHTTVRMTGSMDKVITTFPKKIISYDKDIALQFSKTGIGPAYVSVVYNYLVEAPEVKDDVFKINSYFTTGNDTLTELKAGINTTLRVTVTCDTLMEYVMIEVPIPAGCVQKGKERQNYMEANRDNFKDKTVIYCNQLGKGTYTFDVPLEVRYKGHFKMNPARASMMYYPDKYGNNKVKDVKIK